MVLLAAIFVFYMLLGFLDIIGLSTISNILLVPFWALLVALGTWIFVRFTGNSVEIGEQIDRVAQGLVDNVRSF